MPRVVVIHFGAHRTGTTYLQRVFSENREDLAARNIHYVSVHQSPEIRHAYLLARHALRDGDNSVFDRNFRTVADFLSEHLRSNAGHLLVSYEGFLGDLSLRQTRQIYPHHAALIARLMSVFEGERVHGAFAVREYGAFVESGYKYLAQTGLKDGFRRYAGRVHLDQLSWGPIVSELKQAFGPELSLWRYEDFAKSPTDVVDWLFQRSFGQSSRFLQFPAEASNASVSRAALPALLLWNRLVRRHRRASNGIYRLLLRSFPVSKFGHPRLVDRPARESLRRRYAQDVDAMRADAAAFYRPVTGGAASSTPVDVLSSGAAAAAH